MHSSPHDRRRDLYRAAASFVKHGGMSWTEFWDTPMHRLRLFSEALNEQAEHERAAQEAASRR